MPQKISPSNPRHILDMKSQKNRSYGNSLDMNYTVHASWSFRSFPGSMASALVTHCKYLCNALRGRRPSCQSYETIPPGLPVAAIRAALIACTSKFRTYLLFGRPCPSTWVVGKDVTMPRSGKKGCGPHARSSREFKRRVVTPFPPTQEIRSSY